MLEIDVGCVAILRLEIAGDDEFKERRGDECLFDLRNPTESLNAWLKSRLSTLWTNSYLLSAGYPFPQGVFEQYLLEAKRQ